MTNRFLLKLLIVPAILIAGYAYSQDKTISGKITDSKDGSAVVGASVVAKGTTGGTSTNAEGNFSLSVPSSVTTLVITSVGFDAMEVDIAGKTSVAVTLQSQLGGLNEVVVIGYGTARKKDLTGSTASVAAKDFNKGTYAAPDQLIQGKAAGVLVINNTGQPGGSTTVRIRGSSSIRSGNQPLFVLDGIPLPGGSARPGGQGDNGVNPLNFINPGDIANIEILKDASATAIYGSRGANGVILITTKRGKSGAPTLDVNASAGISNVAKQLEVLSADEYREKLADPFYNIATDPATGRKQGDFGSSVDAFDEITRTALTQNYNVALSGGTETGRYRLSVGYLRQDGIVKTTDLEKLTANLSANFRFLESKKLGLDINLLTTQTSEHVIFNNAVVGFTGNVIGQALQWNPTQPLYKPGTDSAAVLTGSTTVNPIAQLRYFQDRLITNTVIASISPSYKFTNDLEYKLIYSVNKQVGVLREQINRLLNNQGVENRGFALIGNGEQTAIQVTNTLNYTKQITSAFNLNAVIGHEYLNYDNRFQFQGAFDFPNNGLNYYDFMQYGSLASRQIRSYASPTTELQSYFARAIINYKDKYLFTGTFRADGSTRFGENNQYGYFPSVGVAWNVTKEDFLANISFINNLKVRLGWGETGNQEFSSGASLNRFVFGDNGVVNRATYGNPDLKWETSQTTNVGIDFSVFNNRVSGSIDYFYKKTTDVLFESVLADPAPSGTIWKNLDGYVLNKGVEIMLTGNLMRTKDIDWNLSTNVSFLKNVVEGLTGFYETGELRGQGFSNVLGQRVVSGQPLNVWYMGIFEGIDKTTGQSIYTGGDASANKFYVGSPNPKTILGISTDFSYKDFVATINMNGTFGHYLFNNTAATVLGIGNLGTRNVAKSVFEGDAKEDPSNAPAPSTRNLEKGNYLKMANVSVGYRIGNIGKSIRNLYISLTGQNLFVITNYTGFDPEVNTNGDFNGIPSIGIEYVPYPSARTFQIGINFSL
jgi:iron complex outermembrane receptor protein